MHQNHPTANSDSQARKQAAKVQNANHKSQPDLENERWCMLTDPNIAQTDGNAAPKDDFTNSGKQAGTTDFLMKQAPSSAFPTRSFSDKTHHYRCAKPNAPHKPPLRFWQDSFANP